MASKPASSSSKKPAKKTSLKKWGLRGGAVIILLIVALFLMPRYGTIKYGICRTFIELQEPYPLEVQIISADEYGDWVGINYKKLDPFGLESVNNLQCYFKTSDTGEISLKSVDINGKKRKYPEEDPERIKKFNKGIISILKYQPDLKMPSPPSDDIKDYR